MKGVVSGLARIAYEKREMMAHLDAMFCLREPSLSKDGDFCYSVLGVYPTCKSFIKLTPVQQTHECKYATER